VIVTERRLRVVVVGLGLVGAEHVRTIQQNPRVQLAGLVTRRVDVGEAVPRYEDLARALTDMRPDLVVIATPHGLHAPQIEAALSAGCHVLTEKPLALTQGRVEALSRLAAERGRLLVVGLQRRYEGLARVFRELRNAGDLGDLRLLHGLFAHRFAGDFRSGWRADPTAAGRGILHDSALHLIDLLLFCSGRRAATISGRALGADPALPDSFNCTLTMDDGSTIVATGSYLSPANSVQEEISIWGTKGALFARRFCREWNAEPPALYYKSLDGTVSRDYDASVYASGRPLPLETTLRVLTGDSPRSALLTESADVLETHRVVHHLAGA
jgi:predicted dehydrogenase